MRNAAIAPVNNAMEYLLPVTKNEKKRIGLYITKKNSFKGFGLLLLSKIGKTDNKVIPYHHSWT